MPEGFYHLHRRKRVHQKLEKYPHEDKKIKFLDNLVLGIAIAGPIFDLPQLIKIYVDKSAQDVSFFTWFFFALFAIPWFIYGVVHKEKPIIISYALWIIVDCAIVTGIILYG